MNQASEIFVQRFSDREIEIFLYGLLACLFLAILGFCIGLWMHSRSGLTWSSMTKPVKIHRPMRRLKEEDLKSRSFNAYGNRGRKRGLWKRFWRAVFGIKSREP